MNLSSNLSKKSFAVYGLGTTGKSVVSYFNKIGLKNYTAWDDFKIKKNSKKIKNREFIKFKKSINLVDYILVSPGINIKKSNLKKILMKNKHKIITDLDLFYILNPKKISIVVTGSNGKSTTCKIIEHVLNKNKISAVAVGNIGKPLLNINFKKKQIVIIEASSFQLSYSKYVRPNYALLLNISKDHQDWHGSMRNYINAKFKIFSLQKKNNIALINNKKFKKVFIKNKYKSKLKLVNEYNFRKIKNRLENNYLNSEVNQENMKFVYVLSKFFKIKEKNLVNSVNSFNGLAHRYEIFLQKNKKIYINDSKATSFEASKFALKSNKNIFWIVGGFPKEGDKFKLGNLKKNIIKSYIIGKHFNFFKNQLNGKIPFEYSKTLRRAIISIFKDLKKTDENQITILLSPASASYDQFNNFEERGNQFKKLIKLHARKYDKRK